MAPTRIGTGADRATLAKRKREADRNYYREQDELEFLRAIDMLGEDLMESPVPVAAAVPVASCAEAYYKYEPMQFEFSESEEEWGDGTVTEVESEGEVEYVGSAPSHKWKWGQEVVVIPNNGWQVVIEIN